MRPGLVVSIIPVLIAACAGREDAANAAAAERARDAHRRLQRQVAALYPPPPPSDAVPESLTTAVAEVERGPAAPEPPIERMWERVHHPPEMRDSVACNSLPPMVEPPRNLHAAPHPRPVVEQDGRVHVLAAARVDSVERRFLLTIAESAAGQISATAAPCVLGVAIPEHSTIRGAGDTLFLEAGARVYRLVGDGWSRGPDRRMPDAPPLAAVEPPRRRAAIADRDSTGRARWWVVGGLLADDPAFDEPTGITSVIDTAVLVFAVPKPTYASFARLRAWRVANGYDATTIFPNRVGPTHRIGRRIWFGNSFYDGEGSSGVGGIGYFDLDRATYEMFWAAGSADFSARAIYVAHDAVYVGLEWVCECTEFDPRGAAIYNIATRVTRRIPISGLVTAIGRSGQSIVLLSTEGVFVARDTTPVRVPLVLAKQ